MILLGNRLVFRNVSTKKHFMGLEKRILLSILFPMLFSSVCYSKKQPEPAGNNGVVVVELFTSEGCSSCPAAETVLAGISNEYKNKVYVLEFHVDYWDNLGWKDVFSSGVYTERQQKYATLFHLSSTYTPQAIVNGRNELVGSDRTKLHSLINGYLQKEATNKIRLSAMATGKNVAVKYSLSDAKGQVLNIALVEKNAETNVRRGENSGRKLAHINIVRELKTITAKEQGALDIILPDGLSANDCIIIAYAQDKDTFELRGAAEVPIN